MQDIDSTIEELWVNSTNEITNINAATENWKAQTLPLARIKKIMKIDEGILQEMERERLSQEATTKGETLKPPFNNGTRFMIAGEAPVLLGKACELLIKEVTARAWRHTERNRRRTLQRQDVHAAVGESEVYDFLIDIVPRMTTNQGPTPPSTFPEQHVQQTSTGTVSTVPMAAPVAVPVAGTEMATMTDAERYSLQMQQHMQQAQQAAQHDSAQAQPSHITPGYEQYYMQMQQAGMQAVAGTAMPPGTVYMQAPPQEAGAMQWASIAQPQQPQQQSQQQQPESQSGPNASNAPAPVVPGV